MTNYVGTPLVVKARAGANHILSWHVPTPFTSTPVLSVRHPTEGTITPTVTVAHASCTVSAVATDRKTLTVTGMGDAAKGLAGDKGGRAWMRSDVHGAWPVRVRSAVSETSIVLADPLPLAATVGSSLKLAWAICTATLSSATVTATAQDRPVPFTWAWTTDWSSSLPNESQREEGLLYVVRQPFATGLDESTLLDLYPTLTTLQPRRQTSWAPQIELAEQRLVTWLRRDLQSEGAREDDVGGSAFLLVHAHIAGHIILRGEEAAEELRRAQELYADVMRSIPWLDTDGDGVVDAGEADVRLGVGTGAVASLFHGDSDFDIDGDDARAFARLQKH